MTINQYEVELKIITTHGATHITRTEHAYTLLEAMQQALIGETDSSPGATLSVVRIGPSADAIRAAGLAELQVAEAVASVLKNDSRRSPLDVKKLFEKGK